ncbi:MAG TPA: hypothetical protein P5234_05820 [Thermoanaerobaculaceae bacterium]|nr:hypothetical protein [Thermoanaerobaculaceae bacterium]HRS15753.1 hypothetical protein [Thermoanaerobaculaceae bacterium]
MSTPEHNIEAYRMLGDILTTLRAALRAGLEGEFGPKWFAEGLPGPLFARLVQRKEKEKAVSVLDGSYFSILEYADFSDIKEICLAQPRIATFLKAFGGNSQICQARFLELQGLHDKLAGLRSVSESELSFLQHLLRRLHQVVDPSAFPEPDRTTWTERPNGGNGQPVPRPSPAAEAPLPASAAAPPPAAPAPAPQPQAVPAAPAPLPSQAPPPPAATPAAEGGGSTLGGLAKALQEGDDKAILAALLGEVRHLSEHMTDSQGPATPPVWERVSESAWYARRYASLGMRPVSDFYNLYLALRERIGEGAGDQELQNFLQAHAYQQVIMAVGVFFQQNKVA